MLHVSLRFLNLTLKSQLLMNWASSNMVVLQNQNEHIVPGTKEVLNHFLQVSSFYLGCEFVCHFIEIKRPLVVFVSHLLPAYCKLTCIEQCCSGCLQLASLALEEFLQRCLPTKQSHVAATVIPSMSIYDWHWKMEIEMSFDWDVYISMPTVFQSPTLPLTCRPLADYFVTSVFRRFFCDKPDWLHWPERLGLSTFCVRADDEKDVFGFTSTLHSELEPVIYIDSRHGDLI